MKKTKQGIRDLSTLPAKSKGRRIDMPERECEHLETNPTMGGPICVQCGAIVTLNMREHFDPLFSNAI